MEAQVIVISGGETLSGKDVEALFAGYRVRLIDYQGPSSEPFAVYDLVDCLREWEGDD